MNARLLGLLVPLVVLASAALWLFTPVSEPEGVERKGGEHREERPPSSLPPETSQGDLTEASPEAASPTRAATRTPSEEDLRSAWDAFLAWSGDRLSPGHIDDNTIQIGLDLRADQHRLAETREDLRDYPFLDPIDDAPPGGREVLSKFINYLEVERNFLKDGTDWDTFLGPDEERLREDRMATARRYLDDRFFTASLPPDLLVQNPWYGEVDEDFVRAQRPLLQSLRLEYLHAISPLVAEIDLLKQWRRFQGLGPDTDLPLPDDLRIETSLPWIESRIQELEDRIDVHRRRYLRALGEAIGATELPPVD